MGPERRGLILINGPSPTKREGENESDGEEADPVLYVGDERSPESDDEVTGRDEGSSQRPV